MGDQFALLEAEAVLVALLQRFEFKERSCKTRAEKFFWCKNRRFTNGKHLFLMQF